MYLWREMEYILLILIRQWECWMKLHAMKQIARSGKSILFVATKKQAKSIVSEFVINKHALYHRTMARWFVNKLLNY